jgi:hypothetical protein
VQVCVRCCVCGVCVCVCGVCGESTARSVGLLGQAQFFQAPSSIGHESDDGEQPLERGRHQRHKEVETAQTEPETRDRLSLERVAAARALNHPGLQYLLHRGVRLPRLVNAIPT